ncbi:traO protein, partial [Pseudomonas syringae pv. tomato]|nr:traO protein [Pseudomonas syringae pv. tomato]MBX6608123.1 traO protein [Pseudomonas syringae pv. tomato]
MANENDAKRDMKLTAALVGGALVVVFGGAYYLWDWLARPEPAQSKVDLGRVAQASRSHSTESPAYRDLLKQYNEEGASTAKNENSSFIASMPMEQTSVMLPVSKPKPAPQSEPTARRSRTRQDENSKDSEKKEDPRLKALL